MSGAKSRLVVSLVVVVASCAPLAEAFDIIAPAEIEVNTSTGTGMSYAGWGWVIATDSSLLQSDLDGATFFATIDDPLVLANTPLFLNTSLVTPLSGFSAD